MGKGDGIELGRLMQILYDRRKIVGTIVGGCTIMSLIVSFALPKTYESTTLVIGRGGSDSSLPLNYIERMRSSAVLEPIIDSLKWEDEKKKPDAKSFAKSVLKIENIKQTNLITVTATGTTPEEAQKISQGVVDNFLAMQTDLNKQTQSLLVKFLNERIATAKQEAEEAANKLASYSKEHKIYAPDEQVQLAITCLNNYDKAISDAIVDRISSQAEYSTASAKMGEQKIGSKNYHINDNVTVKAIRQSIVGKQMELVGYQERFTDENPQVKQAKSQLSNLNQMLVKEVNDIADSNVATINSAYADLLKKHAVAEAKISAANASEAAIRAKKAEKEAGMDKLPDDAMNYLFLKSDANIKQNVYLGLVLRCEQCKIREAMESMDIQVVDSANVPDAEKPIGPRKKLITVIGFVIGCLISFGYGLICYKREDA